MTSHLFGGVWCSSSSTYALRKTCQDNPVSDSVRKMISRSFYVDDMLPSFTSIDAARQAIFEAKRIISYGGFNLTKFVANDPTLMAEIDADDRAPEIKISSVVVSKALCPSHITARDALRCCGDVKMSNIDIAEHR